MRHLGRAPVRISLCNGGDTDYYIKAIGWGNLLNVTLSTHGYICELIPNETLNKIEYEYINKFKKTSKKYSFNLNDKTIAPELDLIFKTIIYTYPTFKGSIKIITNVPEKSGLGGSSSLIVAMLKAFSKLKKQKTTPEEIAKKAYYIERILLGINGGYQDQWAAAFGGGVNYLEFKKESVFIEPLWLHERIMQKLEESLLLFYLEPRIGDSGNAHDKLEKNLKKQKKETIKIMLDKRENVSKTRNALLKGDLETFAKLLNEEQKRKEMLNPDTTTIKSKILYGAVLKCGAIAGKISGAGKGGCAFFICEKKYHQKIITLLEILGAKHLPIKLQRIDDMGK